eukprot:Lankesteria_metandrocarpae@DN8431_c0_g1_i1.p1
MGPCAATRLKSDGAVKEEFAWKCSVEWPCKNSPPRDFVAGCPLGWTRVGGSSVCMAPNEYVGGCSSVTDFRGFSDVEKVFIFYNYWFRACIETFQATWAAKCGSEWPAKTTESE